MSHELNLAWERINALGGTANDDHSRGYVEAIDAALEIIEGLGGQDPAALKECDCCGKQGILSRCFVTGIETFACEECRS